MAVIILPDAQQDLLSLQEYMLDKRSEADWLKAEDEIFEKLALVDTGF
jgi:toxin ParE1/3/4